MRAKLTVAYDGSRFRGWARQPGERTVEGVLRDALERLYGSSDGLVVAGRTDTGVHALANVVSVDLDGGPPLERATEALNTVLPDDVAVLDLDEAPDDFHARYAARSRSYRYRIWRQMDWGFFLDEGQVGPQPGDFGWNRFHAGYGFRFFILPKLTFPIAIDVAHSNEKWRLYVNFNTSF